MRREGWPETAGARDRFVVSKRGARPLQSSWIYQQVAVEDELADDGTIARSATVFLTGRECPWRCVMCDLWRFATPTDTPVGAIPAQLRAARQVMRVKSGPVHQIKLYNAANFFDPRAVPEEDYDAIAAALDGVRRIVVECHPALVGDRVDRFLDALEQRRQGLSTPVVSGFPPLPKASARLAEARFAREGGSRTFEGFETNCAQLEVAMGLETAHPEALERLNKRMTLRTFANASRRLLERRVAVRVFLLISPPFIAPDDQQAWLVRSVDTAFRCGASVVSLVPTRTGNGALDAIGNEGHFIKPDMNAIERSISDALPLAAKGRRVFVDLWDLKRFARCRHCFEGRRARLHAINLGQRALPLLSCEHCGDTTA